MGVTLETRREKAATAASPHLISGRGKRNRIGEREPPQFGYTSFLWPGHLAQATCRKTRRHLPESGRPYAPSRTACYLCPFPFAAHRRGPAGPAVQERHD